MEQDRGDFPMRKQRHGTLAQYKQLILEANTIISQSGWHEKWPDLVRRMDVVWGSGPPWWAEARLFMQELYEQRLNR